MHRHASFALVLATTLALVVPAAASADTFSGTTTLSQLEDDKEVTVTDVAARGRNVVVGWEESPEVGNRRVFIRSSTNGGASFGPRIRLDTRSQREIRVDVCGGYSWATSGLSVPGSWLVALDKRSLTSSEVEQSVLTTSGIARRPDVACGGERLIVAWFQQSGGVWRVKLHARGVHDQAKGNALPPFDADLGTGDMVRGLAVAATSDRVYVAWYRGNDLRVRRYSIGSGSKRKLTALGTTTFSMPSASVVHLGANGSRVAVTYWRNSGARVRVSTNKGSSWGSQRTLATAEAEAAVIPSSITIRGSTIIAALSFAFDGGGSGVVTRSTNGSGTGWSPVSGSSRSGGRMVAALSSPSGTTRIVQAWDQSLRPGVTQRVRFRRSI